MAFKDLILEEIMDDQIDARAFEAPAPDEDSGEPKPRQYRIRKGDYLMEIRDGKIKEASDGRRYVSLVGALYNTQGTYRGTVFPEISWQYRENRNGKLDLKSRLFGNLVRALGAPSNTPLPNFLEGIQGETVQVNVTEFFRVEYSDLLSVDREDQQDNGYKSMVFINADAEGNTKAQTYLDLGYKSMGMVLGISSLSDDEEIPF